jgi:hypothetical protein
MLLEIVSLPLQDVKIIVKENITLLHLQAESYTQTTKVSNAIPFVFHIQSNKLEHNPRSVT